MRVAAQAKMGYYPTPDMVYALITGMLRPAGAGNIRIFDPCAGKGEALRYIGECLNADTFGVELDEERAEFAQDNLNRCLFSDYTATRISNRAFSLLYLNPPYDWEVRENDLAKSERYEKVFLRNTIRYLTPKGILVYLIPQSRLDKNIAEVLAYRFGNIRAFRFPEDDYKAFKQVVIFGELKRKAETDEHMAKYLTEIGENRAIIPYLDKADCEYIVPISPSIKNFIFRTVRIEPAELEAELEKHSITQRIGEMVSPLSMAERIKPIMPLRRGHLAQLLACGMMNGVVFDRNGENPLLIKGITKKEVETRTEYEGEKEKIIETDKIVISVYGMNEYGETFTIS